MEITFLLANEQYDKKPGDFCQVETKYALKLIEFHFARPTIEEDRIKPIEPTYVEVVFLRSHHRYAYSAGAFGTVDSNAVEDLVNRGYVELI